MQYNEMISGHLGVASFVEYFTQDFEPKFEQSLKTLIHFGKSYNSEEHNKHNI